MVRVYIVVEGQTEIAFVKELLLQPFSNVGIYLHPRLIGKPGHKGGDVSYKRAKSDIIRFLKQEHDTYCTTMFDFYGLSDDFPGFSIQGNYQSVQKAEIIEEAIKKDIIQTLENTINPNRFIPYIQMHEFEALLFSDPQALARGIYQNELAPEFARIRKAFLTPEDIDDNPITSPSKRIINLYKNYNKSTGGILAAIEIGLATIRSECKHFDHWLGKLEAIRL